MSMTQFAMVEELAFLVKDNLPCKHLVLTMEEALVTFLQNDTSSDGVLELEPMNSYCRVLLHRLADIFGFAHESVGIGDERHLVLERCPETSIPPILVSDILGQYSEPQSLAMSNQLLRRKGSHPVCKTNIASLQLSLEAKEVAYSAARERIFSEKSEVVNEEPLRQKPRSVPVVARRMIAHALGQRICEKNQDVSLINSLGDELFIQDKNDRDSNVMDQLSEPLHQNGSSDRKMNKNYSSDELRVISTDVHSELVDTSSPLLLQNGRKGIGMNEEDLRKEHVGAAKRMFAHALRMYPAKDGVTAIPRSKVSNQNNSV